MTNETSSPYERTQDNDQSISKRFGVGMPLQFFFDRVERKVQEEFKGLVFRVQGCRITPTSVFFLGHRSLHSVKEQ
jgi:hypothetical protein